MPSGESGIRTHAPFRTNGFQDRLVMTTSIPLQIVYAKFSIRLCSQIPANVLLNRASDILPSLGNNVNNFFTFF